MADGNFESTTDKFLTWLSQIGVKVSPKASLMDLRREGRGRGLAIGDFEEDEIIFSIPRSAVLNVNYATSGPGNSSILSGVLEDMPNWLSLTIVMMTESLQGNSRWSPYFAVLPSQLDSLVFWSPAELTELQASAVFDKIGKAGAEDMFRQKVATLGINGRTVELFHQMASIVMAYAFKIPDDGAESDSGSDAGEELVPDDDERTVLTMIPLADILNADAYRNNARLICGNEDLEMRSIKPVKKGLEILNDYGALPRSDLLRRYGYITHRYAPHDVAELATGSIVRDFQDGLVLDTESRPLEKLSCAEVDARLDLARRGDVYEDTYDIKRAGSESPYFPDELVALIYLLLVGDETLASIEYSQSTLPSRSKMETELFGALVGQLLRLREREYPTSVEEDKALLKGGSCSYRQTMAIKVRQGEKIVLRETLIEAAFCEGSNKRMQGSKRKRGTEPTKKKQAREILRPLQPWEILAKSNS